MNTAGLLLLSRFASPPNLLSLCGPDKQKDLSWYCQTGKVDQGTVEILKEFQTAYPYLKLIASQNNIVDPFHPQVVEAYWLGNCLLNNVSLKEFNRFLTDGLYLKKKLDKTTLSLLLTKLPRGAVPHHAFHVVNIYKRTGNLAIAHTLKTMEACLINWGQVTKVLGETIIVKAPKLVILGNKLVLGPKVLKTIKSQGEKDIFSSSIKVNDWVSFHWDRICIKLNPIQLTNLVFYTNLSLKLATYC